MIFDSYNFLSIYRAASSLSRVRLSNKIGSLCEELTIYYLSRFLVEPHLQGKAFEVVSINFDGVAEGELMPPATHIGGHVSNLNISLRHNNMNLDVLTSIDHNDGAQAI